MQEIFKFFASFFERLTLFSRIISHKYPSTQFYNFKTVQLQTSQNFQHKSTHFSGREFL